MKTEVIYNSSLHFEHKQWRSELAFWEDELKSFNKRLSELVMQWTDKNVLVQLEHFQNQFTLHGTVIDKLQDDIALHEINMSDHSKKGEDVLNQSFVKKHMAFRNRMETQRQIYADLKKAFFRFLSKHI
ncbi:hypothetical protein [Algibacter agarivorans]